MTHKDRKTRKKRGSRSCGYGTQKHRGAGSRGGRGMAGSKKHKWSFVSKYMPEHFGRFGFKRPLKVVRKSKVINIGYLDENLDKFIARGTVEIKGKKYLINLKEMDYDKLLGSGKAARPLIIKVDKCSKSAIKKVNEAGGKVECPTLIAKSEDEPRIS